MSETETNGPWPEMVRPEELVRRMDQAIRLQQEREAANKLEAVERNLLTRNQLRDLYTKRDELKVMVEKAEQYRGSVSTVPPEFEDSLEQLRKLLEQANVTIQEQEIKAREQMSDPVTAEALQEDAIQEGAGIKAKKEAKERRDQEFAAAVEQLKQAEQKLDKASRALVVLWQEDNGKQLRFQNSEGHGHNEINQAIQTANVASQELKQRLTELQGKWFRGRERKELEQSLADAKSNLRNLEQQMKQDLLDNHAIHEKNRQLKEAWKKAASEYEFAFYNSKNIAGASVGHSDLAKIGDPKLKDVFHTGREKGGYPILPTLFKAYGYDRKIT